jgi:hypothetical protein
MKRLGSFNQNRVSNDKGPHGHLGYPEVCKFRQIPTRALLAAAPHSINLLAPYKVAEQLAPNPEPCC